MNGIKTFILILAMTGLLVWIGNTLYGEAGTTIALVLAIGLNFISYFFSDRIVLAACVGQIAYAADVIRADLPAPDQHSLSRPDRGVSIRARRRPDLAH